jgi:hypothetical protein
VSENNGCVISKDNMFVACASIVNGLFVLNIDDSPIYYISAKRSRPNDLSPTYIWHCRLGHISEKRMKNLHNDGLLGHDWMSSCPQTGPHQRAKLQCARPLAHKCR